MRRVVALVLAVGAALLFGAAPAWAHSQLDGSSPADGTSVATPPSSVSLTFNEDVQPGFTVITLIGPDGKDYHRGDVTETDQTVTVGALPLGPAGVYQIGYRVVSADGHPVSGKTSSGEISWALPAVCWRRCWTTSRSSRRSPTARSHVS